MSHYLDALIYLVAIAIYSVAISIYIPKRFYSYVNLLIAGGSIIYGIAIGLSFGAMGLAPSGLLKSGVLIAVFGGAAIVVLAIGNLLPPVHKLFADGPSKRFSKREAAHELLLRVPFGTALSEEVIFRSVLLGILLGETTQTQALIVAAIAFGLWHIIPTLQTVRSNDAFKTMVGEQWRHHVFSVITTVLVTGVAGFMFGWLRVISGSILVPWALHTLINGFSIGNAYIGLVVKRIKKLREV